MVEQSVSRGTGWQPAQYAQFRDERSRPFYDLATLVQREPAMRVTDLGCGTGELTAWLHEELGARETVAIDSSPMMLAESAPHMRPGMRFEQADIMEAAGRYQGAFDLVFSNAALQWILDHNTMLPRVASMVRRGGQIAIQVPNNGGHFGHQVHKTVAREEPYASALGGIVREDPVQSPEWYATFLHDVLGCTEQRVRLEVYAHPMASTLGIVEWVKGSVLTWYRERMPADLYARFVEEYQRRLVEHLGMQEPYFYTFSRILMWGRMPE